MGSPTRFTLHDHHEHLLLTYFPEGSGPVFQDRGRARLFYRRGHESSEFFDSDIAAEQSAALGSLVTVTLFQVPDLETVTFTLVVPEVEVADAAVEVSTLAFTRVRHETVAGPGGPDTFTVAHLHGAAEVVWTPA